MNEDDRKVAAIAKKIRSIHQEYNSEIYNELYSMAPNALPKNQPVEIRIGLDYYAGASNSDISYVDYLRGAVLSYMKTFADSSVNAPKAQAILESMDGFPWGGSNKITGTNFSGTKHVYVGWLPAGVRHEADRGLARFINQKIRDPRFKPVSDGENGFNARLSSICDEDEKGETVYKSLVLHEITHYLIKTETRIGDMEGIPDVGGVFGATPQVQEYRVGNNDHLSAIDEAFAYLITDTIMNTKKSRKFTGYENSREISLVHECLHQQIGLGNLGKAINTDIRIFEKIAEKGQVWDSGNYRNPIIIPLVDMLPAKTKRLLDSFLKLDGSSLHSALRDVKNTLEQSEGDGSQDFQAEVRQLETEISWEEPSKVKEEAVEKALKQGKKQRSYNAFVQSLERTIKQKHRELQRVEKMLKNIIQDSPQVDRKPLERGLEELEAVDTKLKEFE